MSFIQTYGLSITGDCTNSGLGAVYFEITGDMPNFGVVDGTGLGLLPTSADTTTYSVTGLTGGTYWAEIYDSGNNKI
jgi:hypothetical protein